LPDEGSEGVGNHIQLQLSYLVQIVMTDNATAPPRGTRVEDASTRSFSPNAKPPITATAHARQLPPDALDGSDYQWYPMYVKYRQELKVQKVLTDHLFKTFIPMEERRVRRHGTDAVLFVPAIHNMIFVYSSKERITWMKMHNEECTKMQYMSFRNTTDGTSNIITVPEAQMRNIITAATIADPDGLRSYIDTPPQPVLARPDRMIQFVSGPFKGVIGIIRRVNKNRVMLIELPQYKSIQIKISSSLDIDYL